jgi:hypothetical protein
LLAGSKIVTTGGVESDTGGALGVDAAPEAPVLPAAEEDAVVTAGAPVDEATACG